MMQVGFHWAFPSGKIWNVSLLDASWDGFGKYGIFDVQLSGTPRPPKKKGKKMKW